MAPGSPFLESPAWSARPRTAPARAGAGAAFAPDYARAGCLRPAMATSSSRRRPRYRRRRPASAAQLNPAPLPANPSGTLLAPPALYISTATAAASATTPVVGACSADPRSGRAVGRRRLRVPDSPALAGDLGLRPPQSLPLQPSTADRRPGHRRRGPGPFEEVDFVAALGGTRSRRATSAGRLRRALGLPVPPEPAPCGLPGATTPVARDRPPPASAASSAAAWCATRSRSCTAATSTETTARRARAAPLATPTPPATARSAPGGDNTRLPSRSARTPAGGSTRPSWAASRALADGSSAHAAGCRAGRVAIRHARGAPRRSCPIHRGEPAGVAGLRGERACASAASQRPARARRCRRRNRCGGRGWRRPADAECGCATVAALRRAPTPPRVRRVSAPAAAPATSPAQRW